MSGERRLCELLWGLNWEERLPMQIEGTSIGVRAIQLGDALPFIAERYPLIFHEDVYSPFRIEKFTESKRRYYAHAGDFFGFFDANELVGLFVGTPLDWSSYYLRSGGLMPAYQGRGLMPRFFTFLFDQLRTEGVDRVEAEASPSNTASVSMLNRLRFNVSGTTVSERWGVLTRFTRFLSASHENQFLNHFCSGVHHQRFESRNTD